MKWFKRKDSKDSDNPVPMVRVVDMATHEVTTIPARELAPYMVEAQMEGIEGTVWLDARDLKQGDNKHPPFTEEIRDYFREIKSSIDEFHCLSIEEWEDGFRRDTNPNKEIALWLHLARLYRQLTADRDLSTDQRRDYFGLLITCLNSPPEHIFDVFSPSAISHEEARNVVAHFYSPRFGEEVN